MNNKGTNKQWAEGGGRSGGGGGGGAETKVRKIRLAAERRRNKVSVKLGQNKFGLK